MKKQISLIWLMLLLVVATAQAQDRKLKAFAIGFYNQENLFDTIHDEGKRDYDFLPDGSYRWNGLKYAHKLKNMSKVLAEMGTDKLPYGCAIIGLAEVENDNVLNDLVAQEPLAKRGMKYVHFEGPDRRGVDCALLYNPSQFKINMEKTHHVLFQAEDTTFKTRPILVVDGQIDGEHVIAIVAHLPSRLRGDDFYRVSGAKQITAIKEKLQAEDPDAKIFIMGDMNDDPTDRSMTKGLRGKASIESVGKDDLYNPWISVIKSGTGTLMYDGKWNLFDQILISPSALNYGGKKDYSTLKYVSHQIFRRDYLFQTEGRYKGGVKRTTAGGQWLDGYSDHLPVVIYVAKWAE